MRVVVTGMGAVSGFGRGVDALWAGVLAGRRATVIQPQLEARGLDVGPVALVPDLPFDVHLDTRVETMCLWAAHEALGTAGLSAPDPTLALCFGTTKGGIGHILGLVADEAKAAPSPPVRATYAGPAFWVAAQLGMSGPVEVVSVACTSSNVAIGNALEILRRGEATRVLAGGADALSDFVISGFASLKALDPSPSRPFDRDRHGLNLGEGAGFIVMEREDDALARGAHIHAVVRGYGLASDAVHMTGPDREGRGAARAIVAALHDAGCTPADIDAISAHGTGTVFNDLMESHALALALGPRSDRPLHSVKSALGHTLGAAGVLEAIVCVRALETGTFPPTAGHETPDPAIHLDVVHGGARSVAARTILSTSSGFGGTNAALILARP